MKEIITNELIRYKAGFISGKYEIVDAFRLGRVISLNRNDKKEMVDYWYSLGYKDGFEYFSNLIDEGKSIDLGKNDTNNIMKEMFCKRVVEYNEQNQEVDKQVPIGKFKI